MDLFRSIQVHSRNKELKNLLTVIGLACLISDSLVLYIVFLWAYLVNDYTFVATINNFGEAHVEFILIPTTIILGLYSIYNLSKNMKNISNT